MTTAKTTAKTELVHPRTGRKMNIDTKIYELISRGIYHELKKNQPMTWTELANAVSTSVAHKKINFPGSIEWYTISIRNDMETKGIIRTYREKGKMMNALTN